MASYPDSVKSFVTRSAGQTIAAAHVNDLQDEVNAMESGLLNGTAPLNSSNSTMAALNVTGNCTVAGKLNSSNSTLATLSVTGGCTLAGTLQSSNSTLADLRVTASTPHVALRKDSTLSMSNDTPTVLTFNVQEQISTSALHSTTTNPSRVTPPSSGVYMMTGFCRWKTNSTAGQRELVVLLNSTTVLGRHIFAAGAAGTPYNTVSALYKLETTDFVELRANQDSGSTLSIDEGNVKFQVAMFR